MSLRLHKFTKALMLGWLLALSHQASVVAGESKQVKQASKTYPVTRNFIADAKLTPSEVKQVLELAKKCGINHPSEVRTFHYLPTSGRGISVKSLEKVDGRNTSFDMVTISKKGWDQGEAETNSIRVGNFWAEKDAKYSTLLRRYEFKKAAIQISIGKGVDLAFADKVIPLIDGKKVLFDNDSNREQFEELKDSKPVAISKSYSGGGYELRFNEPSMRAIMFDVKNGQVVITGVAHINI